MPRARRYDAPIPTAAARAAAAPAPQFIIDDTFEQADRMQFGRTTIYNPKAIRERIAAAIRSSVIYTFPMDSYTYAADSRERDLESFVAGNGFGSYYFRIERSWGVGGDLTINQRYSYNGRSDETDSEHRYRIGYCTFEAQVNWSSTGRSIASAQASVVLYQELINLGALIQSIAEYYETIGSITRMIPNPAYVAPETTEAVV